MSNKTPIFQPQHFNDFGFHPQINYFQVLEEARKHKTSRTVDLHYKLQKPNTKDDSYKKIKKTKKRWWTNPFLFFKSSSSRKRELVSRRVGSVSGPVYVTESRSNPWTTYRTARKPGSGPVDMPYISLKELNMDQPRRPAIPIYLVT